MINGDRPPAAGPPEPGGVGTGDEPFVARSPLERLGLALVAVVMAAVFGGLAAAAWIGGELFLAVMAGLGAVMTVWAAFANLRRG